MSQRYLMVIQSNISPSTSVTTFAAMTGHVRVTIPYAIQSTMPALNVATIQRDSPAADRVRHVFATCGTNASVVSVPARDPRRTANAEGSDPTLQA